MGIEQHDFYAPGESEDYRRARNALLEAELALIEQIEKVAAQRRALPPGGEPPEDYVFEEGPADLRDTRTVREVRLSDLFAPGRNTLVLINMMFRPGAELPCPSCNSLADGYNATAPHISDRVNFALVTKAPIAQLRAWAAARDWRDMRLLSSFNSSFNRDYNTETQTGDQAPSITVFHKGEDGVIRHFYSVESAMWSARDGRDPRQLDLYWPLWQLLDLTPEGRGTDWYPRYAYGDEVMR
jgi:predicted dithiol-disulfide oxidoreductase (DUF899 family)